MTMEQQLHPHNGEQGSSWALMMQRNCR